MRGHYSSLGRLFGLILVLGLSSVAQAILSPLPVYSGGTGGISFGVSSYGNPQNNGAPTFIANNITGLTDILSSPGGGTLGAYQTANPVIGNNIASYAGALPGGAFQVGGANGNGNFGTASAVTGGPGIGYSISDSAPGGGSASYLIASEVMTYNAVGATPLGTHYGAWLTMGGNVSLLGSADIASLAVTISSATAGSPFLGGVTLPKLVLAISRNAANSLATDYNVVTVGGSGAGLIVDNLGTGVFRALSVDNLVLGAAIPAGDVLTVRATLTAYADPADISGFDATTQSDLLGLTGALPTLGFSDSDASVPEPASIAMAAGGTLLLLRRRRQ